MDLENAKPEDFPHWKDPNCKHPKHTLQRDGMGYVCKRCGIVIIVWR